MSQLAADQAADAAPSIVVSAQSTFTVEVCTWRLCVVLLLQRCSHAHIAFLAPMRCSLIQVMPPATPHRYAQDEGT